MVEFAIVLPLLLLLVYAIISFGAQFLVLQTVKQASSDGARAAIAGTTPMATCVASETAASCEQIALADGAVTQDLSYLATTPVVTSSVYEPGASQCPGTVTGAAANGGCIVVDVSYTGEPIVPPFPGIPSLHQQSVTTVLLNAPPAAISGSGTGNA